MTYTYDDFVTAANKAGLMNRFSAEDLQVAQKSPEYGYSMLSLIQDGDKATTPEQRLLTTTAVNQLRQNYGLSATPTVATAASSSTSEGDGTSDYQHETAYQQALKNVADQTPFQYDAEKDDSFVNYRAAALRERQRAMADTLAKSAVATGGVPSTAAIVAAQQAADYYNSQIADAVPTFERTAYQRYLDSITQNRDTLDILGADRANYQQYLDEAGLDANTGGLSGILNNAVGRVNGVGQKIKNMFSGALSSAPANNATSPNSNGNGGFIVGDQTLTANELLDKVASGEIIETYDPVSNTYTYTWDTAKSGG